MGGRLVGCGDVEDDQSWFLHVLRIDGFHACATSVMVCMRMAVEIRHLDVSETSLVTCYLSLSGRDERALK